jgi:hypothetical protein
MRVLKLKSIINLKDEIFIKLLESDLDKGYVKPGYTQIKIEEDCDAEIDEEDESDVW